MLKKITFFFIIFLTIVFPVNSYQDAQRFYDIDSFDNMPILERDNFGNDNSPPVPKRGPEFRRYLAPSVKIAVNGASGSGTIIHYDKVKNIAYVATCGHLWTQGVMNADEGKKRNIKCKVITWYHNDLKLDSPKSYESTVIFYSYINGQDTGLITFNPDWEPNYFRLGSKNYNYIAGQYAHSVGCDAGTEVAHYEIKMLGIEGADLVSEQNSPRPGRSGGGLMDDNGYYIGTCWGTQYRDGTGKGYFTPLSVIHKFWSKQAGYNFLLEQKQIIGNAKQIKINDRSGSKEEFRPEYILLP
jgi:hypothetical protein